MRKNMQICCILRKIRNYSAPSEHCAVCNCVDACGVPLRQLRCHLSRRARRDVHPYAHEKFNQLKETKFPTSILHFALCILHLIKPPQSFQAQISIRKALKDTLPRTQPQPAPQGFRHRPSAVPLKRRTQQREHRTQ